jgi:hypothetical protein
VPGTFRFGIDQLSTPGGFNEQGEETYSLGQFTVLYEHSRTVANSLRATFTTGIGLPAGSHVHDLTKEVTGGTSATSRDTLNTEDTLEIAAYTFPLLLGLAYDVPVGGSTLSIGAAFGGVLVGARLEETDVRWAGTPPNETRDTTTVTRSTMLFPTYALLANVAFRIPVGPKSGIVLGLQAGVLGKVGNDGETTNHDPGAGDLPRELSGAEVGGATFGGRVGWSLDL